MDNKKYIFSLKGDELASELVNKIHVFQEYILKTGIYRNWSKNQKYYENDFFGELQGLDIIDTGEVGELKAVAFNHFRNVIRHMLNQITAYTPAFDVSAANTDVLSRRAAKLGKDIINYYFKVRRASKHTKRVAEKALVYGDGWLVCEWNPAIGKQVAATESGRVIREGDFDFEALSPYDVYFDYTKLNKDNLDWIMFRRRKNKYDLAKSFPGKAKEIIGLDAYYANDLFEKREQEIAEYALDTADVYVYSVYHKASNALPKGKYAMWVGGTGNAMMLYEGDSLYGEQLPVFPLSPADFLEKPFGFTEANTIRGPQEFLNVIISAMTTNAMAGGVNNIWTPTGSNLNLEELTDGMNLIQSDSDKVPQVISFYQDNPGLKDLYALCNSTIETLSGQNAVVRGNVQDAPNLKSGVALATVINMAQQYSQALEKAYIELFEDVASFLLKVLKTTANTDRLIDITGKMKANAVVSFTSDDLEGVSRVIVDQTNPISKQPAGKIEIAMELLKIGQITAEQFFDVINTGNLDVAVEADEKMLDFIAVAKEKLLDGEVMPPMPGINHQLYIKEIHALLYDYDIVANPANQQVMQNILQTINQQMQLLRQGDEIANLIYGGQQPTPQQVGQNELMVPPNLQGAVMGQGIEEQQATQQAASQVEQPVIPPL